MADTYTVERQIRVDAPAAALYERIADFRRWPEWSPFERLDPDMERSYSGADAGLGAIYEWSGNMKAGTGRREIVEATADRRVVIDQQNRKPLKSEVTMSFTLEAVDGATVVSWSMTGPKGLMTRALGVFKSMDSMVGSVFEEGLADLKAEAERAPDGAFDDRAGAKVA